MLLLTELYDMNRFKTLDTLCSYVGLIPNTSSSGEKDTKTGMTSRRNALLRAAIIESAWTAVRKDPALMMAFNELCKHMIKTKAIIRIARKLLSRIRYVLKNQQAYVPAVIQ
jgi:transposase